jgi:hypothetical protein
MCTTTPGSKTLLAVFFELLNIKRKIFLGGGVLVRAWGIGK